MALKDILVHIDHTTHNASRLQSAIGLAVAHDAHLTGLYVITHPRIPNYVRNQINEDVLRHQAELAIKAAKDAEASFNDAVARADVRAEWRCVDGETVAALSLHGRYADVVIVGQRDPEGEAGPEEGNMPDQLILGVGRPVLVVPRVGDYPAIGERIIVAWDASRLATRAVNDALPFLTSAKKVVVMAVNPHGGVEGHGEIPSADICLHLARHGVNVDAQHVFADDIGIGDMLLSRAADEGMDMLVTGAYGHARWRELVLGGVTRHVLNHMTLPTLMCH